jgi:hypothetical protein
MWQLLASETEVVIHSGFVYVPLLYDPQLQAEMDFLAGKQALPPPGVIETIATNVIYTDGGYFIKSLSLASLVENYPAVFPEEFESERLRLIRHILPDGVSYQPPLDTKLKTILFEIFPHFIRPHRALGRQQSGATSVPAYLASKISVNRGDTAHLERLRERETSLKQVLLRLEHLETPPGPAPEKHGHGRELITWFRKALQTTIVTQEVSHWQQELTQVQDLLNLPEAQLAVLLSIAAQGALEVDGFGFSRDQKHPGEYLVYKRTGEYLLKDYFGRLYLFPDCRVGVATTGPFHPMVLEMYKHPLLRRIGSRQKICLNDYQPASEFGAAGVIKALEEGLGALFYGYNSRKRNGYNSLDTYGRHQTAVDFEDWRLAPDDPRVRGGELEVKNDVL